VNRPAAIHRASAALLVAGPLLLLVLTGPGPFARAPLPSGAAGPPGPGVCPECRELDARLPAAVRGRDPHELPCGSCHHPHGESRTDREWMQTCTTSGCHPRAWTETIFHRVEPEVFVRCANCHSPHVWTADGNDCASCHAPSTDPAVPTREVAVAAMAAFPHERHAALACSTCHASEDRHASVLPMTSDDCQTCHHEAPVALDCARCHGGAELADVRRLTVPMRVAFDRGPEPRVLPFDHQWHRHLPCATCHTSLEERSPTVDCASCHEGHHRADVFCGQCHNTPPKEVHPITLHDRGCAGSGCHGATGFEEMTESRDLCLACHQEQKEHEPQGICSSCHLVTFGQGAGR
jgi:hypothetical protein